MLLPAPAISAPPSPGTVVSPIDKPVYQPERTQTPDITRDEKAAPAVPESALTVRVDSFRFRGNTTFSDEVLKNAIAEYEGRELSIADIYYVADIVESYYRYNGYLLTSVYVPAQKINTGTILLEVIEGRLGEVRIRGELDSYEAEFLARQAEQLQPGRIIDDDTLERETLLMGDLPGLEARAVVAAGEEYGSSDVVFVTEEDRVSGVLGLNNYGRKSIGEKRLEAGVLVANPLLQGDMLNVSLIAAESSRMLYGRVDYDAPVNTLGTRVGVSLSAFDYEVDTDELALPPGSTLEGSGTGIILRASHPLQRSRRDNTYITVQGRRSSTEEEGTASVRPDSDINLLEVFLAWDHTYRDYARTSIQGGVSTNFTSRDNLLDTDSQKLKLTLDARHYQPFLETWYVTARVQGVYSPDPLVDVERFRIGGQGSVRAYPSAEIAGDKGGLISLDVGKNFVLSEKWVMTPRVFADAGRVYRIEPVGLAEDESLSGYGAGVSVVYGRKHTLDFEVVEPGSDKASSDGRDTRVWLGYRGFF